MRWTVGALLGLVGVLPAAEVRKTVDYTRDIKPILSEHCYTCHGPDAGQRKAGLRLDVKESALKKAIRPGQSQASALIERITSTDADQVMPPPSVKKPPLTPAQVTLLKRWIDEGAAFESHWSYRPLNRSSVPTVAGTWPRTDVDRFVAAAHVRQKFTPSPEADRRTLIRRLSFDLTGLPPTPEAVEAFVNDPAADAYDKLVDRLFASPHYGERLALLWLDLVRYADTIGYHSDTHRDIAPYRDYVIEAFQSNMPFDRFTIEQIAGDLLPQSSDAQKIASGYNRLLMTTEEGGAQAKEYLAKYAADRVRNVSAVWLGSTMGCAECHDHKYDPFTQRDFYRLASFFADVREIPVGKQAQTAIPTPAQRQRLVQIDARVQELKGVLARPTPELATAQADWEKQLRNDPQLNQSVWRSLKPTSVQSSAQTKFQIDADHSVLTSGPNPPKDVYTIQLTPGLGTVTGLRLETLTHPSLANKSLSRGNGNFVLTGIEIAVVDQGTTTPVAMASAQADFEQTGHPIAHALDGNAHTGWAVAGHEKAADHRAVFTFRKPLSLTANATLRVTLKHESPFAGHGIGRFRLSVTSTEKPSLDDAKVPEAIRQALLVDAEKRTPAQRDALAGFYRGIAPLLQPAREELARLESERQALTKQFPQTLITESTQPRMMRVLPRGNWLDDSGEVVSPDVPSFLGSIASKDAKARATRLELARWLVSKDNPLTARVMVNRLWRLVFGHGLVRSMEDFGSQGAVPTHPELLDWLAVEFIESGWDVQKMLRLMVRSAAYRQSSLTNKDLRERDPQNLWLARQARYRLDAELVRDNALAISGLLVPKVGGPSVKPYQPPGFWAYLNFPKREYQPDPGENRYRRGLYTYWCRTFPHPSLTAFDAPSREECTAERPRSSTPLQALVLLNDPNYVEAARVLAEKTIQNGGESVEGRIDYLYRQALSRTARAEEKKVLLALLTKHRNDFQADRAAAERLIRSAGGQATVGNLPERAAWLSLARVVLNLHETMTRE